MSSTISKDARSPTNGKATLDLASPEHKSSRSGDTPRKRSHRHSRSRSRDRHSRSHRDKGDDDEKKRKTSRSRERDRHSERRRRSRSHEDRRDRDKDRDRERHGSRSERDREIERDRERDRERRRRKRDEERDGDREPKRHREEADHRSTSVAMDVDTGDKSSRTSGRDRSRDIERPRERREDGRRQPPRDDPPRRSREPDFGRKDPPRPIDRDSYPPLGQRRPSPSYAPNNSLPEPSNEPVGEDDSEARSVFVSQLAARLTARDLGYFFEDKLGPGSVKDSRIVTDRLSRRSKGIAYVELKSLDLVSKAIALSGTVVMGLPIMVQLTESERNKQPSSNDSLNLPPGVSAPHHAAMQLYVGSLHFNLTESDIKQVFEAFGELEFVELHKDPQTGRSKGYAFIQYKRPDDAKMALEQMEGFELAGRTLRVNTVHEKGTATRIQQSETLDELGSLNNNTSRAVLMAKLLRTDAPAPRPQPIMRPNIPQVRTQNLLLKNMFDPEEETERDWDKELEEEVKGECEEKYGAVEKIKVVKESQGEIYVSFKSVDTAAEALEGLNGRWFGGKQVSAAFITEAMMQAQL